MKKIVFLVISILFLFQFQAGAKGINEKAMKEKANEIGLLGQLDKANEIMGEETKFSKGKTESAGWDTTSLALALVWGSIGTGYFMFGKKQSRVVFIFCGIGLCVFPMFVSDNTTSIVLGIVMTVAPFKIDF